MALAFLIYLAVIIQLTRNVMKCDLILVTKKCPPGMDELYKRWFFDNVKEYMGRKEERIKKKSNNKNGSSESKKLKVDDTDA